MWRSVMRFLLPLFLGVLMLWFAFRDQDFSSLGESLSKAHYSWLILGAFVGLCSHVFRAARWRLVISAMGYKTGLWNTFFSVMVGYLANLAFPRMGEVSKCGALGKSENIPIEKLLGTVLIERLIDLISLVVIAVSVILFNIPVFVQLYERFFGANPKGGFPTGLAIFGFLALLGLIFAPFVLRKLRNQLGHKPWFIRISDFFRGILEGIKAFGKMENKGIFLLHTFIIWGLYWLMLYLCVFSLDATASLSINEGWMLLVVGSFGIAAPVQGGIGAYHAVMSVFLGLLPGHVISKTDALAFATLSHANQTLMVIVVGFLSLIALFIGRRSTIKAE